MGAGAGRGQLGVWQTDKLWTQPQGVQVSPPAGSVIVGLGVVSCWQSLWGPPRAAAHWGTLCGPRVCLGNGKEKEPWSGL